MNCKFLQGLPAICRSLLFFSAALAAAALAGCGPRKSAEGSFDKTIAVRGSLRLELVNGNGDSRVTVGGDDQVRIHAEIHTSDWSESRSQSLVRRLQSDPPIMQEGSVIRIGSSEIFSGDSSVDYTIAVPADTDFHGATGSGGLSVSGLQGAAKIITGSGDVTLAQIGSDVRVTSGSGDLTLSNIAGQTQITSGSGDVTLAYPKREVRIETGDGDVQITQPENAATVQTGSGDVEVSGASSDLRIRTSSGEITISGQPLAGAFWDLHALSGDVTLNIPPSSSFELYAHSSSGDIDAQIPITMEGTTGAHELRARIGDGKAHVEISTTSGSITLQ